MKTNKKKVHFKTSTNSNKKVVRNLKSQETKEKTKKKSLIEYYEVSPLCFSPSELTNMGPDVTVLRAMCEVCVFPH